jgi:hypothetical protein
MLSDGRSWTDRPDCVHPVLREVAVRMNDRMPDGDRDRLYPFAADLVGTASPHAILAARLALWCARERLVVLPDPWRTPAERAVACAEQHLAGRAPGQDCRAAAVSAYRLAVGVDYETRPAMLAAAHAAYAAYAAYAVDAVAAAVRAAGLACEVVGWEAADMIAFLAGVIDEHRRLTSHKPPAVSDRQWDGVRAAVGGGVGPR